MGTFVWAWGAPSSNGKHLSDGRYEKKSTRLEFFNFSTVVVAHVDIRKSR